MNQIFKFTTRTKRHLFICNLNEDYIKLPLEYNITFLSIEKTGRKPCSIRKHIIGIVMVSERDLDNVICVWSYNVYAL